MNNIDLENLDDEVLFEMLELLKGMNDELGGNDNE